VFTESGGVFSPVIQEYYDLMPYGEVIDAPTTQESVLFTGKPRDIESGLDIFPFRPYSNQLCRWICADEPFADNWVEDPQSWNLFAYCRNNPINKTDPDGRAVPAILIPALVYVGSNPAVQRAGERALAWTAATLGVAATAAWAATQVSAVNESTGYWGQQHYHKESQADQGGSGSPDPEAPEDPKQRGRESEKRVLEDMGEQKNTQKVSSQEGNSIPDINNSNYLGDIKDTQRVTNTKQIRIQRDAANQAGKQHIVVAGTNTKVSSTVTSQGTQVIRRDDLGPKK